MDNYLKVPSGVLLRVAVRMDNYLKTMFTVMYKIKNVPEVF